MIKLQTLINHIRIRLYILAWLSTIFIIAAQLFGHKYWQLELITHFTVHICCLLFLAIIWYPQTKKHSTHVFFVIIFLLLFIQSNLPFQTLQQFKLYTSDNQPTKNNVQALDNSSSKQSTYKIAYQNVNIRNAKPEETLQQLQHTHPHFIILLEAGGERWQTSLNTLNKHGYQSLCSDNQESPFALQVLRNTKMPSLVNTQCQLITLSDFPAAKIKLPDDKIIFVMHPPPPVTATFAKHRQQYLQQLQALINQQTSPVLVIGDMNSSVFSPLYRQFVNKTNMQNTKHPALPTWLPFFINIDHALTNYPTSQFDTTALSWMGSDHRGLLITW